MANAPHPADRSVRQLISDASTDLMALVRAELALAKSEIRADLARAATGAGLVGFAIVCLSGAGLMLLFAAAYGLVSLGLATWAAFLIVAGALLLLSGLAALIAKSRLKKTARGQRTLTAGRSSVAHLQSASRKNS